MPADPVAAGRKGGQSKSAAKLAAARRNGFQRVEKQPAPEPVAPVQTTALPPRPAPRAVFIPASAARKQE